MADTTMVSRVVLPRPTTENADPGSGSATGLDAGASADGSDGARAEAGGGIGIGIGIGAIRSWSAHSLRPLLERHRRRVAAGAAGVVVLGALLALPPVRAQLRDSFTKVPQPYTALYFTSPPQVDGTVLTVPVSLHTVDTGTDAYTVRVWTVDAQGKVDDSRTVGLTWDGQALSTVVTMPIHPEADFVWVSLGGSDQTLHYKIAVA